MNAAPLSEAYVNLLRQPLAQWRARMSGQTVLCALRDAIADLTGQDAETVQNEHEALAVAALYAEPPEAGARIRQLEAEVPRQPKFEGTPLAKLDSVLERGWKISGYAIEKDGEHGLATTGGFVGWWTVASNNAEDAIRRAESLEASLKQAVAGLRLLLRSVDACTVELKPGQSLAPAGSGRTNALISAANEVRAFLDTEGAGKL